MNAIKLVGICGWFLLLSYAVDAQRNKVRKQEQQVDEQAVWADAALIESIRFYIQDDYEKALAYVQKAIRLDPSNSVFYYHAASLLAQSGDYTQALHYIKKALNLYEKNPYYWILQAHIQSALFAYKEAAESYEYLLVHFPRYSIYYYDLGLLYEKNLSNYRKAKLCYEKFLHEVGASSEEIIERLVWLSLKTGEAFDALRWLIAWTEAASAQAEAAISALRTLQETIVGSAKEWHSFLQAHVEIANHPLSKLVEAIVLYQLKQAAESRQQFRLLFHDPYFATSPNGLIFLLELYIARFQEAEDRQFLLSLLPKVMGNLPDNLALLNHYADLLYESHYYMQAADVLERSLALRSQQLERWIQRLECLEKTQQYNLLNELAQEVVEAYPFQSIAWLYLARAKIHRMELEAAQRALQQVQRFMSEANAWILPEIKRAEALLLLGQDNTKKACQQFEQLMKEIGEHTDLLNDYIGCLLVAGKLTEANKWSERLVKIAGSHPVYIHTRGWVLYQQKQYEAALPWLKQAAEHLPTALHLEHYGDVLYMLGQSDQALLQWQMAAKMSEAPDSIHKKILQIQSHEK